MSPTCCEDSTLTGLVESSGGPWPVWWVVRPTTDGSSHQTVVTHCPFCGLALESPPDRAAE
jgi:hypothetical protein